MVLNPSPTLLLPTTCFCTEAIDTTVTDTSLLLATTGKNKTIG